MKIACSSNGIHRQGSGLISKATAVASIPRRWTVFNRRVQSVDSKVVGDGGEE